LAISTACGLILPLHVAAELAYGGKTKEEYVVDIVWPTLFPVVAKSVYVVLVGAACAACAACSTGEDTAITDTIAGTVSATVTVGLADAVATAVLAGRHPHKRFGMQFRDWDAVVRAAFSA
jgi:hypothetical protein